MKELGKNTFIFEFEDALSKEFCSELIDYFENKAPDKHKGQSVIKGKDGQKDVICKDSTSKVSIDCHIVPKRSEKEKYFDDVMFQACYDGLQKLEKYVYQWPHLELSYTGFQVQKSEVNKGKFEPHCDHNREIFTERQVAVIFYLNDVEEAGTTDFLNFNEKVKPEAGKMVFFPTSWPWLHAGVVPKSNDKYIVTTFFVRHNLQKKVYDAARF